MSQLALIYDGWHGPVIARLLAQAGYTPVCLDRRGKAEAHQAELPDAALQAKTIAQAVKGAQAVLTALGSEQSDEDVYMAGGGIFEAAKTGSLFIDLSPISPRLARELNALSAVHDHRYVEAALLGGLAELSDNRVRIIAAGEPAALQLAMPILGSISQNITEAGLPGAGAAARLSWQLALAGSLMGLVEALAFAGQNNVEKSLLLDLLAGSDSPMASIAQAFGRAIIDEEYAAGQEVKAFLEDLNTALEAADEASLPLPGLETAQQLFDLLQLIGDDGLGISSLALAYYDERNSERFGLDWSLAQKAMDVYERGPEDYDEYFFGDYDLEDYDEEHPHEHGGREQEGYGFGPGPGLGGEGPKPSAGSFFSEN